MGAWAYPAAYRSVLSAQISQSRVTERDKVLAAIARIEAKRDAQTDPASK